MALANDVLTTQLQQLQAEVQTLGSDLRGALPRMNTATENLQISMKQMDEKLETSLNPLIQADLVENFRAIKKAMEDKFGLLDQQNQIHGANIQQLDIDMKHSAQSNLTQIGGLEPIMQKLSNEVAQMRNDLIGEKTARDLEHTSTQAQMATISAQFSAGSMSRGGGSRTEEHLITHKLIMNKVNLTGTEDIEAFDDWYQDMEHDFEL